MIVVQMAQQPDEHVAYIPPTIRTMDPNGSCRLCTHYPSRSPHFTQRHALLLC